MVQRFQHRGLFEPSHPRFSENTWKHLHTSERRLRAHMKSSLDQVTLPLGLIALVHDPVCLNSQLEEPLGHAPSSRPG